MLIEYFWPYSSCGTQLQGLECLLQSLLVPVVWARQTEHQLWRGASLIQEVVTFTVCVISISMCRIYARNGYCEIHRSGMPQTHLRQIEIPSPGLHRTETRLQVKFFHSLLFFFPVCLLLMGWNVKSGLMLWLVCRLLSFSQELNHNQRHFPSWKYLSFQNTKEGEIETRLVAEKQFSCWDGGGDDGYLNL